MARIKLHSGDITKLNVDAIVNAANESLLGGGGVDGAIHAAAGPDLVSTSSKLAPCPPGNARITPGFNLPAKFVIHAVGPVFRGGYDGETETLKQTYVAALQIAASEQLEIIAFPCISTGAYNFPQPEACQIAIDTVVQWQSRNAHPNTVVFCCFESTDLKLYTDRLNEFGLLHRFER